MTFEISQQGQSLIEILFAIAIFTVGVVTIGYLVIDARVSLNYATDLTRARLLASEGIEAANNIRTKNFALLTSGENGLALESGEWVFSGTSDDHGKFKRVVSVEDIDSETKEVVSKVIWDLSGNREKSVSYTTLLSNWKQTSGEAGSLELNTSSASVVASSTILTGIYLNNSGEEDIVITDMIIKWDGEALLDGITLQGTEIILASTSNAVASDENIDVVDYSLSAGSGSHSLDSVMFDGSVEGSNFILQFAFQDQSVRSIYISL
jgi:hypothetical protein